MSLNVNDLDLMPAEEMMGIGPQLSTSCGGSCFSSLLLRSHCDK